MFYNYYDSVKVSFLIIKEPMYIHSVKSKRGALIVTTRVFSEFFSKSTAPHRRCPR